MKLLSRTIVLAAAIAVTACGSRNAGASFEIIPKPAEVTLNEAEKPFVLRDGTPVVFPEGDSALARTASLLCEYIDLQTGLRLKPAPGGDASGAVSLAIAPVSENPEAYTLRSAADGILIEGPTPAGVFYGVQTLRAAVGNAPGVSGVEIPAAEIADEPRFGYRGAHLDVSRHFFPVDSVKAFIDMMALHKLNRFHWHLTDDQGWRAEIKSRPLLTEVGSKRPRTIVGKTEDTYDGKPVEGFYTREQMQDVVRYATERGIEVMPEIDIPGHSRAALTASPELGCSGGPYEVMCKWGVATEALCAGNPEVYAFLDDVFGELCEIFPYTLFHIGGDECAKTEWEKCARCQALADSLGYRSDSHGSREAKLQNYLMKHVADFLEARGKKVIGWDEVLDSDFADGALVMSWRGVDGGIEGARRGHDVVMTPSLPLYFNFYQSTDQAAEPLALGSYVPVEDVYAYEPVPDVLDSVQARHILGAQANLWTEYIPTFDLVQYMELPRMAALSEVVWSDPSKKDFKDFVHRLGRLLGIYDSYGWRRANHVFDVKGKVVTDPEARTLTVELSTFDDAPIHYTLDGSEPDASSPVYTGPIVLDSPAAVTAAAERGKGMGKLYHAGTQFSKATFGNVELSAQPHPRYAFGGGAQLTDGVLGTPGYTDGLWLGFNVPEVAVTVDLGKADTVSEVSFRTNVNTDSWIFDPRSVKVELSDDNVDFVTVAEEAYPQLETNSTYIKEHKVGVSRGIGRYVRITFGLENSMPDWHAGKGHQAFMFIDEIGVK